MKGLALWAIVLACWTVTATPGYVVDGDTFDARIEIWPGLYASERIRLLGVDTPERKAPTMQAALAAKAFSQEWLERGTVRVTTCKRDVFGRLLGAVTRVNEQAVNEDLSVLLVRAGLGVTR